MSYCDNSEGGMWNNKWGEESFVLFLIGQNLHWISLSVISIYKTRENIFQYLEQLKNEEQEGLSLLLLVKGEKVTVLSKIEFLKKCFLVQGSVPILF